MRMENLSPVLYGVTTKLLIANRPLFARDKTMENGKRLKKGVTYFISFMDPKQPDYSWYSGPGVFVRIHDEDFGDGEQHYEFRLPGKKELCFFPRSSVVSRVQSSHDAVAHR